VCSNTLQKDKSSTCLTDQIYKVRRETIVDSMERLQHRVTAGLRHKPLWRGCACGCCNAADSRPDMCQQPPSIVSYGTFMTPPADIHTRWCGLPNCRRPSHLCMQMHTQIGSTKIRKRALLAYALFKKGPLTSTGCDHGAFINTLSESPAFPEFG